jgi:hypothetical protein
MNLFSPDVCEEESVSWIINLAINFSDSIIDESFWIIIKCIFYFYFNSIKNWKREFKTLLNAT